ncbi:hypothetical protein AQF52_5164 [Streptomyces venezuelae]|uniref:hypothetical protein n=1 Tax=Streptomyces gardneri TaxID=66892 RepID=UPI0006BCF6D9|nr:hypothetical protein [Streptomyces gardneri]ALO10758.1 hypothetical protein AQF52_5164 [Streptomyces venezuelae]WRK39174.1 hypothetical protein U0M97_26020 [Streptomyces venezuelae]CUM38755.1 FIG01124888: hypothetical protein [Streptomyces venezuelae]
MPTAIAVTSTDLVLPPTDPQTPNAAVLPAPETRSLDASLADMQQLLARYGSVVVVCPTSAPAAVERRLHAVRGLLESDRIALVRTDLPPLGAAVLVRQLRQLAACDFSPGVLASAARLLAHYIYAGAVLGSVSRLDRVPVSLSSHLKGWLPGAHFAVLAGPTPQIVRLGGAGDQRLAGPEFATQLLVARGQLQTDWPTTALVPAWQIQGPVQEAALPEASPGWWGTGKLVEFAAYLPDLPVLYQLVSSVRRETCHWCGMELIGDRCGFCAAPLTALAGPAALGGGTAPAPGATQALQAVPARGTAPALDAVPARGATRALGAAPAHAARPLPAPGSAPGSAIDPRTVP